MDPIKFINCINRSCQKSISSAFNLSLHSHNHNLFHFIIDGRSYALIKDELVKVLNWFNNFWLFLEVKFRKVDEENEPQINISLSIFQGEDLDKEKYQLFRAEWDDYNNLDEKHAQPHWHITSSQMMENIFKEYIDSFNGSEFIKEFDNKKQKIIDIKKIHFAMNGDWQNSGKIFHKIKSEQQVVKWLQGMLFYLRAELESI